MAAHNPNDRLIDAHEDRMKGTEEWCRSLQEEIKGKSSTKTLLWGIGIMIVILGTIFANLRMSQETMSTKLDQVTIKQVIVIANQDVLKNELKDVKEKVDAHVINWPTSGERKK